MLAIGSLWSAGVSPASTFDRKSLVRRHNPLITKLDARSSLSVGNGSFAFTVDCTGLQTFAEPYLSGVLLVTQAEWAWHTQPGNFDYGNTFEEYSTRTGRTVRYPTRMDTPAARWFRENPHRLGLARIAFGPASGTAGAFRQELDLWDGIIRSSFDWNGSRVEAMTAAHPERDAIAVRVRSDALARGGLRVEFSFPYTPPEYPWGSSVAPAGEHWSVEVVRRGPGLLVLKRSADADHHFATVHFSEGSTIDDSFVLTSHRETVEFTIEFTEARPSGSASPLQPAAVFDASSRHWPAFWSAGACLDLSGSTDPRAIELERRCVLSQYLTAIQCSGRMPPQETGLTGNSWYGKFHGEMHWWHAAHFPLWGRAALLERSMGWYERILPQAKAYAAAQGYRGARWPKMCGPEGRVSPSNIGALLIWQQPHVIYFCESLYRERPNRETLNRYAALVHESAEFMASFAEFENGRYFLGPPLIPAQESYKARETWNPTYELAYWSWGLKTAQRWRERLNLPRNPEWDRIVARLSPLPVRDGLYIGAESQPNFWEVNRRDHPSFLAALGVLPGDMADRETMRRTLRKTVDTWPMQQTWSWDYPMMAMTATRIGEPELALDCLMMDTPNNNYSPNGHCYQRPRLACYLPGNGGLLSALALMATKNGFPRNWQVKFEGLRPLL